MPEVKILRYSPTKGFQAACPYCTWTGTYPDWRTATIAGLQHDIECRTADCNT